jgi:hypothetical protein
MRSLKTQRFELISGRIMNFTCSRLELSYQTLNRVLRL